MGSAHEDTPARIVPSDPCPGGGGAGRAIRSVVFAFRNERAAWKSDLLALRW
jgi:hypothetical protein